MRCRYHRHAVGQFECAHCWQYFCSECVEEISGRYYCSVCRHRFSTRPAMAILGSKQDAEQDTYEAAELGFDIGLLRREIEVPKAER
jgi:hypothetical protein